MISGDYHVWAAIEKIAPQSRKEFQRACWLIRDGVGLSYSIDDFLDTHRSNDAVQVCGKLGIVKAIMNAERASTLYFDAREQDAELDFADLTPTWVSHLFRILQKGVSLDQCERIFENATFVVFNYDRCLEHFLLRAVRRIYSLSDAEAAQMVGKCQIYHPYGTVGELPMQSGHTSVGYGAERFPLDELHQQIRTYTERVTDEPGFVSRIHDAVSKAEVICLLGCGFHQQNLDLFLPIQPIEPKRLLATAYGVSKYNRDRILDSLKDRVTQRRGQTIEVINTLKCGDLLDQYSRAFTH